MKTTTILTAALALGALVACGGSPSRVSSPGATTTLTQADTATQGTGPAAGGAAVAAPGGGTNTSTTLGNGTSGMYTGGEGTYGGRATWGTGAGAR